MLSNISTFYLEKSYTFQLLTTITGPTTRYLKQDKNATHTHIYMCLCVYVWKIYICICMYVCMYLCMYVLHFYLILKHCVDGLMMVIND